MSTNSNENNGHPAWGEILSQIPEEYHHLVKPTLKKWDDGVQERFQEIHKQYEPLKAYEPFVQNKIDPNYMVNAYNLARNFENDPSAVISQAVEQWDLDFVPKSQAQEQQNSYEPEPYEPDNFANNPAIKALTDQITSLQQQMQSEKQSQQESQEQQEFEAYLAELREKHGDFDQDYVVAVISQGVDGEEAINRYKALLGQQLTQNLPDQNNQQQVTDPPPVIGGDGNSGSGLEQQPINFGGMKSGDVDDLVIQQLQAIQQQNNQG